MIDEAFEWLYAEQDRLIRLIEEEEARTEPDSYSPALIAQWRKELQWVDEQIEGLRAEW